MFDPGVKTYLARHFLWNPIAMQAEAASLDAEIAKDEKGPPAGRVMSRTFVDKAALVVTPWHQAMNRLREFARDGGSQTDCGRDGGRHGSCGVGIGEAMMESRDRPTLSLRAGDLQDWTVEKLRWHLEEVAENNLSIWKPVVPRTLSGSWIRRTACFLAQGSRLPLHQGRSPQVRQPVQKDRMRYPHG